MVPVASSPESFAVVGVPEPTRPEFDAFRELIVRRTGIFLNPSKKALLYGRLSRRVRDLGLRSFEDYLHRVIEDDVECRRMIDRITTNETRFFREPRHFVHLADLVARWVAEAASGWRSREIRVWSAGCSTGEEPYSVAMALLDGLPEHAQSPWHVEVLATDISGRVLDAAREATWPLDRARDIPERLLRRFMLQGFGGQTGKVRASPEVRRVVRVQELNLADERYPVGGPFDAIFCRNVLIYFDRERKQRVVERLVGHLAPGGCLFVGHAESVQGIDGLSCVWPTIYRWRNPDLDARRAT